VAGNSLIEVLAVVEPAEVKGLAPTTLVEVSCEIVVVSGQRGIALDTFLRRAVDISPVFWGGAR
jgi:hypothetical protein